MPTGPSGRGPGRLPCDLRPTRYLSDQGQASETLQGTKAYDDTETGEQPHRSRTSSPFQLEALGGYETGTVTGEAQPDDYTIDGVTADATAQA